jgi:hypothetical protein
MYCSGTEENIEVNYAQQQYILSALKYFIMNE